MRIVHGGCKIAFVVSIEQLIHQDCCGGARSYISSAKIGQCDLIFTTTLGLRYALNC